MEKEQRCYQVIKATLAKYAKPPYNKEEIKSAIRSAIREYDYISAVIAYLWGAYINFDTDAKIAFNDIFSDDLKDNNGAAYYFFSFYFSHDFRRTGFDRRLYGDRRQSYSLEFFSVKCKDLRKGTERRKCMEKRTTWTRVTEWTSVPFITPHSGLEKDGMEARSTNGKQTLDLLADSVIPQTAEIESINSILSNLVTYYEAHIRQGNTEWMIAINQDTFHRAKEAMKALIGTKLTPD